MASITLKDLVKAYGDTEVLHHIDGQIADGEFVVIVGPSGCGKSTLLRMIAGLETVTGGDIQIADQVVNDLEPADRDIAMVFQNYALYPHMTVRENMAYGLKIRRISKAEINRRVEEAADILEIRPYLERKPRQLSGGQRQRVAMGRAIVRDPQVFLFDEPLSNLDAKLRVQMRLEIRKLQQKLGVTSIYVTHDQVEAMTLGDRLMVLNGGYVEQFGTPIELYDRPQSMFVGGFIGSPAMNFLPADADGATITLANGTTLAGEVRAGAVTMGIRPEHLIRSEAGPVRLKVQMMEQLGANTLLHGVLEGTQTEMVASLPGHVTAELGAVLSFEAAAETLHFFAPDTQKRIE
ncbi:sn-glycerol-3-phosphate import ATP-binding protein UgpC [Shimia marina]|uniref:sn-glycerol-3-phosphate import ATP-binding protein UgpC n=1 Tax=Shimia marina TaxID=321267 RepID=A0A0P1EUN8_9RHOB|nr:sn-glycerol-3-phosphate import ATP-binding protein UgpC [Shimia marina]CUH54214.1 sn-glycerol-3-phosphate import ATP-binding protein UgpC [Shimia marina]SFD97820.1 carbohydrate ABC transporter ATP-binding protein, CUT1 family [Shimia marina]